MPKEINITLSTGQSIPVSKGESVLHALRSHEVYLAASCGGKGTCGKCRVRLLDGPAEITPTGRNTGQTGDDKMVLACQCFPTGDVTVDVPESSRLAVGQRIAVEYTTELGHYGASISPLLKRVGLKMQPPSLDDSISDLERIRRALLAKGVEPIQFGPGFAALMGKALRQASWDVNLAYDHKGRAVLLEPRAKENAYGIAVDIGTTTVVLYLVNLLSGKVLDVGSTYNSQVRFGDDVITRIVHATEGGGLSALREAVVTDINDMLGVLLDRHSIPPELVESATISGNTTMSQLFWGLDPGPIREEPYIPAVNAYPLWRAVEAGLGIHPDAPVFTMPSVASYVGGDIVSGVLASRMHRSAEVSLFMDIGTNGEIALGNEEWLVTAACSAGPCFEGSGIRHGMRATDGAIEEVKINPSTLEPELGVIGGGRPRGICGTGMIDAISEMFLTGIIDQRGKFAGDADTWRLADGPDGREFVLYRDDDRQVSLAEVDLENLIRAKAAMYAGVSLLAREVGIGLEDISKVYIAGGFGNYLDVQRTVVLGMLPDMPVEKFEFLGNTSAAGAYLALMSAEMRDEVQKVASMMTYIELSVSNSFMDEYMSAMFLPHTDIARFPTVKKLLEKN